MRLESPRSLSPLNEDAFVMQTSATHWTHELRAAAGFLGGLQVFLKRRLDLAGASRILELQLAAREQTFTQVMQHAVFENPASPYRRLLEWAGITLADVLSMLSQVGLDATLENLYGAGVHVTLQEFKGRYPIVRSGLELNVRAEDFDNPLTTRQYEAQTGGSTSSPRRILVDLNLLEHESAYHAIFYAAAGASNRALGIWQPAPPGAVGIKTALMHAKLGRPVAMWFSQSNLRGSTLKHAMFTRAMVATARICGARIRVPEYTPAADAGRVAAWLAQQCAAGSPAILVTPASGGVRTCRAALDNGLDIAGTIFVLGGEPYTEAKAAVMAQCGSLGFCHYAMVECGLIGLACQAGDSPDDVHLVSDKIATIQRDKKVGPGTVVGSLFHTTLLPATPKVMLNVESGDYAVRVDRDCGCGALPSAFRSHLHTIRSYEKLTSEGMNFLGDDLLALVEQVLPARFGGHPTDYQFVEREKDGLPKVSLVVSPEVGQIDDDRAVQAVLDFLRNRGVGEQLMVDLWAQSRTLTVVRRAPLVTSGGKILPLHTLSE
ncbi:MAG: hypothetical protein H7Z74_07770 [Anaerolineae bacterium]|nr:hypothetical protein [Gemmatimonadaceae bacterium]